MTGVQTCALPILTFATLLLVFHANEATFQTIWFMISLLTELAVVLVLRTRGPAFRSKPSGLLLWSTVAVCAGTFAIPFLGPLSLAFGFTPLSAPEMVVVLVIVGGYIAATEAVKTWFYRTQFASKQDDVAMRP